LAGAVRAGRAEGVLERAAGPGTQAVDSSGEGRGDRPLDVARDGRLSDKAIRRGIFHSVPDLINAIETYLAAHNNNPQPFTWAATADQILAKVRRGRVTLEAITH
jgi:hypothetical protein